MDKNAKRRKKYAEDPEYRKKILGKIKIYSSKTSFKIKKSIRTNERSRLLREDLICYLGGKCKKCGFSDIRTLQLDHIKGGGHVERKRFSTIRRYINYIKNIEDTKTKIQLLCANCNWIKRYENNEKYSKY